MQKALYYEKIYKDVFLHLNKPNVDIFLCGGASTSKKKSFRDTLRKKLEIIEKINILYPEDLFMELLNRKKYNLLELEDILAENSDYIVIVSESPGSYAELGAFANNENIRKKTIVLSHTKYKNSRSFITQGPIQHIKKYNKNNVIYYNDNNIEDCIEQVLKCINISYRNGICYNYNNSKKDIDLISGQYYYILLLLYFFDELSDIQSIIKGVFLKQKFNPTNYDPIIIATIKRLFREGLICQKQTENGKSKYILSDKGYQATCSLLDSIDFENKCNTLNRIRLDIMNA